MAIRLYLGELKYIQTDRRMDIQKNKKKPERINTFQQFLKVIKKSCVINLLKINMNLQQKIF